MGSKPHLKSSRRKRANVEAHGFRDRQDVREYLKGHEEIAFIRVAYPDILGELRDQMFPLIGKKSRLEVLDRFFDNGIGIDGSSVTGFREGVNESDLRFMPEARTFRPLPWAYEGKTLSFSDGSAIAGYPVWREAMIFGHILDPEGRPFGGDSRHVLKKFLEEKRGDTFTDFKVGPEFEFYFFFDKDRPTVTDTGTYHIGGSFGEIRKEVQMLFPDLGWECDHHEVGPGQHEVDLEYGDAMDMADRVALIKYALKRVAKSHGIYASFMPKPMNGEAGSGMHVHQSLWNGSNNLFSDKRARFGISRLARKYIAGLIAHGRPLAFLCNQYVNSYKRLVPNHEAPTRLVWGSQNRSAYVRVPEDGGRIELRSPDPSLNPWLGFTGMLAAGIAGVEEDLFVPNPVSENVFQTDEKAVRRAMYGNRREQYRWELPANLGEAIDAFRESEVMEYALGRHMVDALIREKTLEWESFCSHVTDYETDHYLPRL